LSLSNLTQRGGLIRIVLRGLAEHVWWIFAGMEGMRLSWI
jgi:hypothetical protein